MKDLGYGRDYRYAHDEPEAFAAGERYLPETCPIGDTIVPCRAGSSIKIGEALARLRGTAQRCRKAERVIDPKLLRTDAGGRRA